MNPEPAHVMVAGFRGVQKFKVWDVETPSFPEDVKAHSAEGAATVFADKHGDLQDGWAIDVVVQPEGSSEGVRVRVRCQETREYVIEEVEVEVEVEVEAITLQDELQSFKEMLEEMEKHLDWNTFSEGEKPWSERLDDIVLMVRRDERKNIT